LNKDLDVKNAGNQEKDTPFPSQDLGAPRGYVVGKTRRSWSSERKEWGEPVVPTSVEENIIKIRIQDGPRKKAGQHFCGHNVGDRGIALNKGPGCGGTY